MYNPLITIACFLSKKPNKKMSKALCHTGAGGSELLGTANNFNFEEITDGGDDQFRSLSLLKNPTRSNFRCLPAPISAATSLLTSTDNNQT